MKQKIFCKVLLLNSLRSCLPTKGSPCPVWTSVLNSKILQKREKSPGLRLACNTASPASPNRSMNTSVESQVFREWYVTITGFHMSETTWYKCTTHIVDSPMFNVTLCDPWHRLPPNNLPKPSRKEFRPLAPLAFSQPLVSSHCQTVPCCSQRWRWSNRCFKV